MRLLGGCCQSGHRAYRVADLHTSSAPVLALFFVRLLREGHDLGDDVAVASSGILEVHGVIIIPNLLGRTCGRQRHADAGGLRRLVVHRLAGRPSPCPSARPRSSRGHAAACPGRCVAAGYGRPRPGGVMPPAQSAAPWAWPILGRVRRASCPPCSPNPPIEFGGVLGCAGREDKRRSLRSSTCKVPPAPPPHLGGPQPPPPPSRGSGGWGLAAAVRRSLPPAAPLVGGSAACPCHRPHRHPAPGKGRHRAGPPVPWSRHGPPVPGLSGRCR
jgi:hypothetical protein